MVLTVDMYCQNIFSFSQKFHLIFLCVCVKVSSEKKKKKKKKQKTGDENGD